MPSKPILKTRAEATDYQETSRSADVLSFISQLCELTPLARQGSLGQSSLGQEIPTLILSDRKCFTPELARKQKKTIVLVEANIHAGEVEGKESLLALARDLTLTSMGRTILRSTCLVLVPNFNPDGNDLISPLHRKLDLQNLEGQDGPESGVGTRYNGEGFNLNRDSMKQEAPETRLMARYYQHWWPHLFIDCHTTDGSLHDFAMTFDTSRGNEELFAPLRTFARNMLENLSREVERKSGYRSYWYGNFVKENDPTSGWHTYPALPRFGSHYRGLLGRLDVLLETYSYLDFPTRCAVMRSFLLELFRFAAKKREAILRVCEAEEVRIKHRGLYPSPLNRVAINHGVARESPEGALIFEYPAYAFEGDKAKIQSFDTESLAARIYPGKRKRSYTLPHLRGFVPTAEVSTPAAYLAPAYLGPRLEQHGIDFFRLNEGKEWDVERYKILAREKTFSPDVAALVPKLGASEVPLSQKPKPVRFETVLTVRAERARIATAADYVLVPTAQRSGTLAVYLLEPHSDDGLTRWQFLDHDLRVGHFYPIYRILDIPEPPRKAE